MSLTVLIILVIAEIALITLTFTKFGEKVEWLKNRYLFTVAEGAVIITVIFLPITHLVWRFVPALLLIAVRLLFELIRFAVKRKKASGKKNKAAAIVSGVMSIIFVSLALAPAFIFTNYNGLENSGKLTVLSSSAILVDDSRIDEFENDGSFREVPVHFYYPEEDGEYPLVMFSHGAFGYYQSNFSTYTELASNGYVVAALDHPHHAFFTTDTNGQTIIVDNQFINDVMHISGDDASEEEIFEISQNWMKLRTDDENFALDAIKDAKTSGSLDKRWFTDWQDDEILSVLSKTDTSKIGLMGHSMGGATSVALGRERSDISAVAVLDGTMLSERVSVEAGKYEYNNEPYPVPVIDFTKKSDYDQREALKDENGYAYVNEYVIEHAKEGKTVVYSDVSHMDFTDLPLISPTLSSMLDGGKSNIDNEQFMHELNTAVLEWFNSYLK